MSYRLFPKPRRSATAGVWLRTCSKAFHNAGDADGVRRLRKYPKAVIIVRTHLEQLHSHELLEMMEAPVQAEDGTTYYTVQPW